MVVTVQLKNPPIGDYWVLYIWNSTMTETRYADEIPMDEVASFDIPDAWFPLLIDLRVNQWVIVGESVRQVYRVQSWAPGYPDYKPVFIRLPGYWYYNFATEEFEYGLRGTITALELLYNDSRAAIPAGEIPQGEGRLYINVRNDIIYPEVIGAAWEVRDPDGIVIEKDRFLTPEPFAPGMSQGLFSNPFNLSKLGKYTVKVEMLMTIDELVVDSYEGDLCTVIEAVVPEYRGSLSRKELEYDERRAAIPVY
ncbi:hypothetical protein ES703_76414 [subsurface metagenome]